jgi:glycosyltransferase involved in cell wall biosynthesis
MTVPPRVLIWTSSFWPHIGGLAVQVSNMATALRRLEVPLAVLTDSRSAESSSQSVDGMEILRLPFVDAVARQSPAAVLDVVERMRHFVTRFRPDVIHLHSFGVDSVFVDLLLQRAALPLVITRHEHFPDQADVGAASAPYRLLRRARCVAVPTMALATDVRRVVPDIPARTLRLIRYGMPATQDDAPPVPDGPPRFLFLGRLVAQKGGDVALRAFASFRGRHGGGRLRIVGEGPERPVLEALARALGTDGVEFAGAVPPHLVRQELIESSAVLMPSRLGEGFGLVAAEAALARRPVIATRVPGLDEVVVDGETGILVPQDASGALADAMDSLTRDRALASSLADRAHARARQLYAMSACAENYDNVYRQVLMESQ